MGTVQKQLEEVGAQDRCKIYFIFFHSESSRAESVRFRTQNISVIAASTCQLADLVLIFILFSKKVVAF